MIFHARAALNRNLPLSRSREPMQSGRGLRHVARRLASGPHCNDRQFMCAHLLTKLTPAFNLHSNFVLCLPVKPLRPPPPKAQRCRTWSPIPTRIPSDLMGNFSPTCKITFRFQFFLSIFGIHCNHRVSMDSGITEPPTSGLCESIDTGQRVKSPIVRKIN